MGSIGVVTTFLSWILASVVADDRLPTASQYTSRGMERFCRNEIGSSLRDFQMAAELDPDVAPHLWQRGISLFYVGKFQQGREQFESHQRVNPHDVENAAWHFLCVAKLEGMEAARKSLIKIDVARDTRVPMLQLYAFYAGRGTLEEVEAAAAKADTEVARMYANLYLGLYYEVDGKEKEAQRFLRTAAAAKLNENYMHEVAKVHLLQRKWEQ